MQRHFVPALILFLSPLAVAQDQDPESIKKEILEKVRAKLSEERAQILKRISKILDEELSQKKAAKPVTPSSGDDKRTKELERKMKLLEEQREELAIEIEKSKRLAADEEIKREAKVSGPQDAEEAQALFEEALKDHNDKNYDVSILKFKKIHYSFPKEVIAVVSAYNVACGYALTGKKDHALDWLEITIQGGYQDFEHLRTDADVDSLRNEKRYKKLLADN